MRYGIIADIHSNLEALEAVIAKIYQLKVDLILCAGDIVGYGANPRECLDILRELKVVSVAGNHDWAVCGKLDFSYFTAEGQAAVQWTRKQLAFEDIAYLNNLDLCLKNKDCLLVHSSLENPGQFIYLNNVEKAKEAYSHMDSSICLIGHTHVPRIFIQRDGGVLDSDILDIDINPQYQYIVNVGSVGQPRDGNTMASFCVFDKSLGTIENHRVLYDIRKAQQKILDAKLPESLAVRLIQGR